MSDPVGLILLAAGGSSRLGRPKQLIERRGQTLIRHAAQAALGSGCRPIVVVLGAAAEACRAQLANLAPLQICVNNEWRRGIGSSLRSGLDAICAQHRLGGVVIMLVDQPLVDAPAIDALLAAWRASRSAIVAAAYAGTVGVPALFSAELFDALRALPDESGAKCVIQRFEPQVQRVPLPGAALDVDAPADLALLGLELSVTRRPRPQRGG